MSHYLILTFGLQCVCHFGCNVVSFIDFLLGKYTWTFMHSVQAIRLQVEYILPLFSVVHCTVQNLLTFLGKEGTDKT